MKLFGRSRNEDGVMLIEAVVSIFLLAIALSMTVIIVGVLTKNVANTSNSGTSADAAQSALLTLQQYVSGAVNPTGASQAALNPASVSSMCWGTGNVESPDEGNSADGWPASYNTAELNATVGIIYAHDFSMEFCGYGSDLQGSSYSAPNVYEININPSSCTQNNYCPLQVWDLTPVTGGSPATYSTSDYPGSDIPPGSVSSGGQLVQTIGRVWCDKACQTLGISCYSMAAAQAINNTPADSASIPLPPNYSTLCPNGSTGTTPPLFNYYTSEGVGSASSGPGSLNWANAYTVASTSPSNIDTSTYTGDCVATTSSSSPYVTYNYSDCGPMDLYTGIDAETLQSVQSVVLDMTVLAQDNPSSSTSKSTSVSMTYQIWLRDIA